MNRIAPHVTASEEDECRGWDVGVGGGRGETDEGYRGVSHKQREAKEVFFNSDLMYIFSYRASRPRFFQIHGNKLRTRRKYANKASESRRHRLLHSDSLRRR